MLQKRGAHPILEKEELMHRYMARLFFFATVFASSYASGSEIPEAIEGKGRSAATEVATQKDFGPVNFEEGREFVHVRIEEDGYYFMPSFDVSGYKDRQLGVVIYSFDGTFLGYRSVVPPYENTRWDKIPIFVPYSRLKSLGAGYGYAVYAVPLDATDQFVAKSTYSNSNARPLAITWDWRQFTTDTPLDSNGLGFVADVVLHVVGYKDADARVVGLIRNQYYNEFPERAGGPIRINFFDLKPRYEYAIYNKMQLRVPYNDLTRLAPAEVVTLTPALEVNGVLYEGNVRFRFLAGGSLDRVDRLTQEGIADDNRTIATLRDRMNTLSRGADLVKEIPR